MGSSMCQATGFLLTFLGIAAIFNLTAISLFRYYVITWREVTEVIIKSIYLLPFLTFSCSLG